MRGIASETKEKGETSEQSNRGAAAESEAASETSSAHSGEHSDRKDFDILTSVLSTRSEEYRLLFRLPPDEVLVQDFNCALQENILLQGHMYLFVHHICFYSNIFGFETKKTIPFQEITCVRKAKTAGLFPTAIEIVMGGKKHFFASFLSRDEAYRLILDGWAQHSSDPKIVLDHQDLKSETSSQDSGFISERAGECTQLSDDSPASDRNKDANISGDLKLVCNGKNSMEVSLKQSEVKENGEHCDHHQPSVDLLTLQLVDVDAPKIPEYFTMIAEAKFPVQIEDFFSLFISDRAYSFIENFRKRCGDKDFQCTPWRQHEQFVLARDISFMHPVKIPIGAKFGHCQEIQKLHSYRNNHLVIEASQQVSNVPYGDYFKVEVIWSVEINAAEETGCILRVYLNVAFSKKTMFKGKIEQTTRDECREVYQLWINLAHELLQQRNLEKPEVAGDQSTELIQVGLESSSNVEGPSEKFDAEASTMITPIPSTKKNFNSEMNSPLQEIWMIFSSTFRYLWEMLCSYFRSQSHLASTLLLSFAATLVLMQICIVVLLTRAPQVHLVTQGNYMSSTSGYSLENTDWLEKRFNHLKEEMLMLELRMERMRHEYAFLKGYLQSLEQLKSHS